LKVLSATEPDRQDYNSTSLIDAFGRKIYYLRVAVTDRCNLRCNYCMPANGIDWSPHSSILTYEELFRLIKNFTDLGIRKIRLTGGEPLLRKGMIEFIKELNKIPLLDSLYLTTNGVLLHKYLNHLPDTKIRGINLSLDTLRRDRFITLTQRDSLNDVLKSFEIIKNSDLKIKINSVIQNGFNNDEIGDIAEITRDNNIDVRFIEQMPFNGGIFDSKEVFTKKMIINKLKLKYPTIEKLITKKTNADIYQVPGYKGRIGIIDGYSRSFCSSCNRIRLTSNGMLKNCLYDNGVFNFKEFLKTNVTDDEIKSEIRKQIKLRVKNGFEAEKNNRLIIKNSMAAIGG